MFSFLIVISKAPLGKEPNGGDVWVLLIKNTQVTDSGAYVCELNSNPVQKSIHIIKGDLIFFILFQPI